MGAVSTQTQIAAVMKDLYPLDLEEDEYANKVPSRYQHLMAEDAKQERLYRPFIQGWD